MSPSVHVLQQGTRLVLPAPRSDDGPVMLVGGGRSASLRIEGPVAGVWLGEAVASGGEVMRRAIRGKLKVPPASSTTFTWQM